MGMADVNPPSSEAMSIGFEEVVEVLKIPSKPNLGCATTGELLGELTARAEIDGSIDYKTVEEKD